MIRKEDINSNKNSSNKEKYKELDDDSMVGKTSKGIDNRKNSDEIVKKNERNENNSVKGGHRNQIEISKDILEIEREKIRKELELDFKEKVESLKKIKKGQENRKTISTRKRKINDETTSIKKKK